MDKDPRELADEFGGWWSSHPRFPVSDWCTMVSENETRIGYWDWVAECIEDSYSDL